MLAIHDKKDFAIASIFNMTLIIIINSNNIVIVMLETGMIV